MPTKEFSVHQCSVHYLLHLDYKNILMFERLTLEYATKRKYKSGRHVIAVICLELGWHLIHTKWLEVFLNH